ncbi:MAG: MGMT family protein [Nevskiales bacterium]
MAKIPDNFRRIWGAVRAIPRGAVASYGEVARRVGLPRRARLVGQAMSQCPKDLPWHRVVGAGNKIVFTRGGRFFREQKRRLEAEGVKVAPSGRVTPKLAPQSLDEMVWAPR